MPHVKPTRIYDASGRRAKALAARNRIIDVAEQRFLANGYGPTSMQSVALESGVSVDAIYKSFGGKPGLVRAIRDRALRGLDPIPAEQRSDRLHLEGRDPLEIIHEWGKLTAEVAPIIAPILLLVRAAGVLDLELRALCDEFDRSRHRRMTANARRLHSAGHLRAGVSVATAADVLWTYSSAELYELLVVLRKWNAARYGRFVAEAMIAALL